MNASLELRQILNRIGGQFRQLRLWSGLAVCWIVFAMPRCTITKSGSGEISLPRQVLAVSARNGATVATFFDKGGVMVMDPDPKLRDNRLALLQWFISPYMAIADFRLLGGSS